MPRAKINVYAVIDTLLDMVREQYSALGDHIKLVVLEQRNNEVERAVLYGDKGKIKKVISKLMTVPSDVVSEGHITEARERAWVLEQITCTKSEFQTARRGGKTTVFCHLFTGI